MRKLLIIAIACMTVSTAWCQNNVVEVDGGKLQGVASAAEGVTVYRGIPYAAPPVGELRWKRPQPVKPWKGVKIADHFGNICWQVEQPEGTFYWKEFYQNAQVIRSEDCLYLNIWTPTVSINDTNRKLPVALWIHGGANVVGYGHEMTMDGDAWAKRGVILVTINYRLGMFGYFSHPLLSAEDADGVSGNYGTWDQIAALQWVHDNITQFGGDPDNITVLGQSAGAGAVKNLVTSPYSRHLIKHAIIQSGGGIGMFTECPVDAKTLEERGKKKMDDQGAVTLEQMRALSPEDLVRIQGWEGYFAHKDGVMMEETFNEGARSGNIANIDYMVGCTLDDLAPLGREIDELGYVRDSVDSSKGFYQFLFTRKLPGSKNGAFHSGELWYMFHTLDRSWRPMTQADFALSDEMMNYWTNFAKYGNPNGTGEEVWHRFTEKNAFVMTLNTK